MRIGLDCREIGHPGKGTGGIGLYVYHLAAAMAELVEDGNRDELVLFFDAHDVAQDTKHMWNGHNHVRARVLPLKMMSRLPIIRSHLMSSALFARERLDVLHGPANVTPLYYKGRTVVTVHDLAVYDHPEWFPTPTPGAGSFARRVTVPAAIQHAARVIVPSSATRDDLVRLFRKDGAKVAVVPEAAAFSLASVEQWSYVRSRAGLRTGGYVLALSTVEPRKNLAALADGFATAALRGDLPEGMALAVAGQQGWRNEETFAALGRAQAALGKARVMYLGPVGEADKVALIKSASALAYPSFVEGFGLPPLEALALGTPVIASPAAALRELCGDAALYANGYDAVALADALRDHFADPVAAAARAQLGLARATEFSWPRAAAETLQVYYDAMEK